MIIYADITTGIIMNIYEIFTKYQDNNEAIKYLEEKRWGGKVICTKCFSDKTCRHHTKLQRRWQQQFQI